jgi:hypothetical protein
MNYILYLYILPAVVFLIACEVDPMEGVSSRDLAISAIVPGVNLVLGLLSVVMLFCRLMLWVFDEK